MKAVQLAADERLLAAYARYDELWTSGAEGIGAARLELCRALIACGEDLPPAVLNQMDLDREAVENSLIQV